MAHGRSTKSILMIKWIRTIRLSIKNSLSRVWSWFGVEGLGYRVYHANGLDGVVHLKEIFKISTFEEIQSKLNSFKSQPAFTGTLDSILTPRGLGRGSIRGCMLFEAHHVRG